jgi:SAM-dependent methyltransferase
MMMRSRITVEKAYWNKAALDPDVDVKYISDLSTKECLEALGEIKGTALEIGCGVGRLMKDGYHGIDISQAMLDIAVGRKPKCTFHLCDGRTIPYADEHFDSVYSVLLFQHLPIEAVEGYIVEAYRVLKSGGTLRFQFIEGIEDEPFSKHHDCPRIIDLLLKTGFTVGTVDEGLAHSSWVWLTGKKS